MNHAPLVLLLAMVCALPATTHVGAAERVRVDQIATLVTYQPEAVVGVGWLIDLAAIEASDELSVADKLRLVEFIQAQRKPRKVPNDEKLAPFLRMVRVEAELEDRSRVAGETVGCTVTAVSGKPLTGGYLYPTELKSTRVDDVATYGEACGVVDIPQAAPTGKLIGGVQLQEHLTENISPDGYVTLRLDEPLAGYVAIDGLAEQIEGLMRPYFNLSDHQPRQTIRIRDKRHLLVKLPDVYREDIVCFASMLLETPVYGLDLPPTHVAASKAVAADKQTRRPTRVGRPVALHIPPLTD